MPHLQPRFHTPTPGDNFSVHGNGDFGYKCTNTGPRYLAPFLGLKSHHNPGPQHIITSTEDNQTTKIRESLRTSRSQVKTSSLTFGNLSFAGYSPRTVPCAHRHSSKSIIPKPNTCLPANPSSKLYWPSLFTETIPLSQGQRLKRGNARTERFRMTTLKRQNNTGTINFHAAIT